MMVMQPTANLHGIVGEGVVPEQIRQEIRGLLKKYDSIEESPDLWHPNDPAVLEWKQYWFNDTNERNMGQCPLKIRSQVEEELKV
jgi:FPC/CPF motif-containing protein YcgG